MAIDHLKIGDAMNGVENPALDPTPAAVSMERSRISRELHDTLAQTLHALSLHLEHVVMEANDQHSSEHVRAAQRLACDALAEARCAVWDLCPPALEGKGLALALEQLVVRYRSLHWVDVRFEVLGEPRPVSPATALALVRACQEALGNAIRHARARCVRVRLDFRLRPPANPASAGFVLSVTDDGCGFSLVNAYSRSGGLRNMAARVAAIGAHMHIQSHPGAGTSIDFQVEGSKAPAKHDQRGLAPS